MVRGGKVREEEKKENLQAGKKKSMRVLDCQKRDDTLRREDFSDFYKKEKQARKEN